MNPTKQPFCQTIPILTQYRKQREAGSKKPEEIKELLEAGFEYVCQKDTLIFLRKRKWHPSQKVVMIWELSLTAIYA
jgi:hypothetical protein